MHNILFVGSTHGNELSGIQVVENWQAQAQEKQYPSLNIEYLFANKSAQEANVRFVEEDLNRQFTLSNLASPNGSQESLLAASINQEYGPKGNSRTDLVVDIHNTTSNMGATLIILELDNFNLGLARYVKQVMPEANILVEDEKPYSEHRYLCTIGKKGVMIEVGAQPQGVLRQDVYELTDKMAQAIAQYCELSNQEQLPELKPCDAYRLGAEVSFPLDNKGKRTAMIHSNIQDHDFAPLAPGDPMFKSFDGQDITWDGDEETYPHFINEAAYKQLDIAFATASKITL